MIWAHTLGKLEYYLIAAFVLSYLFYIVRIFLITQKNNRADIGNIIQKMFLRLLYFSLIIISLLGPSFGDVKKELKSVGKDVMVLIDVSASMDAYDIPPSRLEKAKKELKYLVRNLRFNDRIGLIVFTGEAYLQCPLTYDVDALYLYLEASNSGSLAEGGTDISKALELAMEKLMTQETTKNDNNKMLVLVSDGEDFGENALKTAKRLREHKIRSLVMGIGTVDGSKIPAKPGFKKDKNGKYVFTKLNREMLQNVAAAAGGSYYEIGKNTTQIENLLDDVNKMEGVVKEIKKIDSSSNKYYYFLVVAFFLIIVDGLVTVNIIRI